MATDDDAILVEQMLSDFAGFSSTLGGLEFYGISAGFRDVIECCRTFSSTARGEGGTDRKVYVFLEAFHGKSTIARATEIEARTNGLSTYRFEGTLGQTQKELLDLQRHREILVIIDGLPEVSAHRRLLLERFNALNGRGLLFARPVYSSDANVDLRFDKFVFDHIDYRPLDKLAWLIGLVRENLRDEGGLIANELAHAIKKLSVGTLLGLCRVPLGERIENLPTLAYRIAEALRLQLQLRPGEPYPPEELAALFMQAFSATTGHGDHGFRLWVEGESDSRILKLVARLANEVKHIDLEEGLTIRALGPDREGGTSRAAAVVLSEHTRRNKDVFLLDSDQAGKHARDELEVLQQDVMLLDPKLACSRVGPEVEIEDFISLSCLDRFYEAHWELRPELEIIRYKAPPARRLVVDGANKETLLIWLEANASLVDLERLFFILSDIRGRFSLRNHVSLSEMRSWRRELEDETDMGKHFGVRPERWSQ